MEWHNKQNLSMLGGGGGGLVIIAGPVYGKN
jgi:hypothetical protein